MAFGIKRHAFALILLSLSGPVFPQTGSSLTFTEVMFNPLNSDEEFVEIYNTSLTETINISGFKFEYSTSPPNNLTSLIGGTMLAPGKFAVIFEGNYNYENGTYKMLIPADVLILKTASAHFGTLGMSNTGDREIYLLNSSNEVIDTYKYSADNAKGISDEKIILNKNNLTENWANCSKINGTPGYKLKNIEKPSYTFGILAINEIMYNTDSTESEYIEFYNTSRDTVLLDGLQLHIGSSTKILFNLLNLKLPPSQYFVLASDSAIFRTFGPYFTNGTCMISKNVSLSNQGTTLLLKDFHGGTIDSVNFSPQWHNANIYSTRNKSLERLNPLLGSNNSSNWSTCVNPSGGTPGNQNSIFAPVCIGPTKISISPNPFSPDNDGFEDFTIININLSEPLSQIRIRLFDDHGRLVRTISDNSFSSSQKSYIYNGLDNKGNPLHTGIYILLVETRSESSSKTEVTKLPLVIARKLH